MKNFVLASVLLISLGACQSKKGFEIHGTVKNEKTGKMFFVNLHTEQQDTVDIVDGKFSLTGVADEPVPFLIFSQEVLPAQTILYADHGTTKIEFTANEPSTLKINGCKTQKEYEEFTALTKPLLGQFDSVQMLAMAGEIDQEQVQQIALDIQKKYEGVNMNFVKNNPKSYVSALLAYEHFRQNQELSTETKKKMLNSLDKKIQESYFGKKMVEIINADESTAVSKAAPLFTLPNRDGKNISLENFKGKYVLVDFWASWCQPCRAENPNIVAAYNKFKNKNFTVLGVSLDENKKQWLAAIAKDQLGWEHVSDLKGWNSSVVSLYNIKSIPSNVLLDPSGKIVAKNLRGVDLENELSNVLK